MSFVAQLATNGNRKHCFLAIYDPRSSIVKSVFDCRLSGVISIHALKTEKSVRKLQAADRVARPYCDFFSTNNERYSKDELNKL